MKKNTDKKGYKTSEVCHIHYKGNKMTKQTEKHKDTNLNVREVVVVQ